MKKKILIICLLLTIVSLTGCTTKKKSTTPKEPVEIKDDFAPNTQVGYLKYLVPDGYKSNPDKIGVAFNDNTRKIYSNKDLGAEDVIYIDVMASPYEQDVSVYAESVNKNLKDYDTKYVIVNQSKLAKSGTLVYGRENFAMRKENIRTVNYAYLVTIGGYLHTVSIVGPEYQSTDVKELAYQVLQSFEKNI